MRKKTLSGDQNFVSGDLFTGVKSPKGDLGKNSAWSTETSSAIMNIH